LIGRWRLNKLPYQRELSMSMPNFLIVGAARAGTTSLNYYLKQHPGIYMHPAKELNFFAFEGQALDFKYWGRPPSQYFNTSIVDIAAYTHSFADVEGQSAIGEASTVYLYWPSAPERIKFYLPACKIIMILRHPADRGFSHYVDLRRKNREPYENYSEALQAEDERRNQNWLWDYYYREVGCYYKQVQRYSETFNPAQLRVFLYEDLCNNPIGLVQQIFRFLEVNDHFIPDVSIRHNQSGIPKNRFFYSPVWKPGLLRGLVKNLLPENLRKRMIARANETMLEKITLSPNLRNHLTEYYRQDILKLQDLIQGDLSSWLVQA